MAYQLQRADLEFKNDRAIAPEEVAVLESVDLERQQHGAVAIAKYHGETGSEFFKTLDVDLSLRHDRVNDETNNPVFSSAQGGTEGGGSIFGSQRAAAQNALNENSWRETTLKFAVNLSGQRDDLAANGYLSFGSNTKFPTLFQQISSPATLADSAAQASLEPEKNRSVEIGFIVIKDTREQPAIYGWRVSGNFFQNNYDNKFRTYTTPGLPIVFYDNVFNASISGLETKSGIFLLRKKLTVELGLSRYFISEKAAFPFKSDFKRTLNLIVDHAGYSIQALWFKEGEQTGWLREATGRFVEITLPDHSNLDLHLSKNFALGDLKLFANASGRNLLNEEDVVLQGIALRDRRFYVTIGAQY